MSHKEMRVQLRADGHHVPRSNKDLDALYADKYGYGGIPDPVETTPAPTAPEKGQRFTYVGSGDTPPHMTNFMGQCEFVRGKSKIVSDPELIKKLHGHRDFVQGEGDDDAMFESDKAAAAQAAAQVKADITKNAECERTIR